MSLPSSIALTYFDIPGPAEAIRLTFYIAEVPFEDQRVSRDEFAKMKSGELGMEYITIILLFVVVLALCRFSL